MCFMYELSLYELDIFSKFEVGCLNLNWCVWIFIVAWNIRHIIFHYMINHQVLHKNENKLEQTTMIVKYNIFFILQHRHKNNSKLQCVQSSKNQHHLTNTIYTENYIIVSNLRHHRHLNIDLETDIKLTCSFVKLWEESISGPCVVSTFTLSPSRS